MPSGKRITHKHSGRPGRADMAPLDRDGAAPAYVI